MDPLRIAVGEAVLRADWVPENRSVREALVDAFPIAGQARRWGDELYLPVEVDVEPATVREEVPRGAVAYWPAGPALCVFWGPTPASTGDRPRAASPVALLAEIADYAALDAIDGDAAIRFELAADQSNSST